MSDIKIIFQQVQQSLNSTVVNTSLSQLFIDNLRVGQNLTAQLVSLDKQFWLVIDGVKLSIPLETVQQWQLSENQNIKLKVKSLSSPVELQVIKSTAPTAKQVQVPLVEKTTATLKEPLLPDTVAKIIDQTPEKMPDLIPNLTTNKQQVDGVAKPLTRLIEDSSLLKNIDAGQPKPPSTIATSIANNTKAQRNTVIYQKTPKIDSATPSTKIVIPNKVDAQKIDPSIQEIRNKVSRKVIDQTINIGANSKVVSDTLLDSITNSKKIIPNIDSAAPSTKVAIPNNVEAQKIDPSIQQIRNKVSSKVIDQTINIDADTKVVTDTLLDSITNSKKIIPNIDSAAPSTKVAIPNNVEAQKIAPNIQEIRSKVSRKVTNLTINIDADTKAISDTMLPKIQPVFTTQPYKLEQVEANVVPKLDTHEPVKVNPIDKLLANTNQAVPNIQSTLSTQTQSTHKVKFEIPVILPDRERFPLLAEKLSTAFSQRQFSVKNSGRSLTELFSQLNRLHQWIADNKTAGRTNNGAQASKLANDLRESLKDLFRYISQKDTLKTGKSIEKALRQSGTFLEKRIASQKEVVVQKQPKSSTELTIHKDIKANLNRVLATALYNLAKMSTTKTNPTNIQTSHQASGNSNTSTSTQSTSQAQKALTELAVSQNSNLLNNIKARLKQFTAGRTIVANLPELEQITKKVLKNVQEALSRSQIGQLTNLRPESSNQQWLFELPVMNGKTIDSFSIFLKEEENASDEDNNKLRRWSVVLQFEIGTLGKIRSMLSWENNKIQVRFLAEQHNTVALVNTELEFFQKMLNEQDIIFEQLTVEQAQLDELSVQFSTGSTE